MSFNLNSCKYDFSSDNINIICLVYDISGSMEDYEANMRSANRAFLEDFSKFEEKNSIAIAKALFNSGFDMTSFTDVANFDTSYHTGGGTALYNAIVYASQYLVKYYNEIVKRLNVRPRITFLVFSDGEDNNNYQSEFDQAKSSVTELNSLDATTVFVAFGSAIKAEIGSKLGFTCIKDIDDAQALISCMGGELSRSCKEQSKSVYSLKSAFFSKAGADSGDDSLTEQAIVDDNFFNF